MPEIIVRINKNKPTEIKTEVEGMRGGGCATALDAFQQATRMTTREQTLKPEYRDEVQQRLPQGRR